MATLTESTTQTFTVSAVPTIRIDSFSGDLRVVTGETGSVTIAITKKVSAMSEDAAQQALARLIVEMTQTGDHITVKTREQRQGFFSNLNQSRQIDIVVTVPVASNLELDMNSGDAEIAGTHGTLAAHLNSGDLRLQDMHIREMAMFHLNSGDLSLRHMTIAAPVRFDLNSGDVMLHDVTFTDRTMMEMNSGDIVGEIVLGESVQLRVETNSGDVHLTLPASTAAHLEASVNAGDITIDGFPVRSTRRYAQASASGDLNPAPTSSIAVELNSGDLVIAAE